MDRIEVMERATAPAGSGAIVEALVLDLLEWIGTGARPYDEVMDAWRTSCPRLTVWEEATTRGYVARHREPRLGRVVTVSEGGAAHLAQHRRAAKAPPDRA